MKTQVDTINGSWKSAVAEGLFHPTKSALEKEGYDLISLEQVAQARICKGTDALISKNGCRTGTAGTITISLNGTVIIPTAAIAANTTAIFNINEVLPTTQILAGFASATTINFSISGIEIV